MNLMRLLQRLEVTALLALCVWFPANSARAQQHLKPGLNAAAAQPLPPSGTYQIDGAHSFAFFGARHHIVGLVRGRFDKIAGTVTVSQNLADCSVDITIDVASISTQVHERDEDLLSPAYFDVNKFPTMKYQGHGIRHLSGNSWRLDGSLTIHGIAKVVPLTFIFKGVDSSVKSGEPARASFHASAATKRADFGMGGRDNLLELGDVTTADVQIDIDVEVAKLSLNRRE